MQMVLKGKSDLMMSRSFAIGAPPTELSRVEKTKQGLALTGQQAGGDARVLDAHIWLPKAAKHYRLSEDLRDYIIVPVPSIITSIPNTNGDSASFAQLTEFNPEYGMMAYRTWVGKPTHCFPEEAPIKTLHGMRKIKNIKVGDQVLTHKGRYREVTHTFQNGSKWLSAIDCQGLPDTILATADHPFWVIDQRQLFNKTNNKAEKGFTDKSWEELQPHWREATDIYPGDFLCVPITVGGDISVDKDFAFLTGLHMAEGSYLWARDKGAKERTKEKPSSVFLTLGRSETELREYVESILQKLELTYKVYWHAKNNTCSLWIKDENFANTMFDLTGEYADKKRMKGELRNWDKESLKWFLGGYISGDGCIKYQAKHALVRCRTASRFLAQDIWQTMALLGVVGRTHKDAHPFEKEYFCPRYGVKRTLKSKGSYIVAAADWSAHVLNPYIVGKMKMEPLPREKTHLRVIVKDGYILVPVKSVKHKVSRRKVYNFEVQDDNSYVAYGVVVHNCEHDNKDITKAKGVILDTYLRPLPRHPKFAKLVKLMAFDRTKDAFLVNKILKNEVSTYSMGMWYSSYTCPICGQRVGKGIGQPCGHTRPRRPTYQLPDGRLAYRQCEGLIGFECSVVADPAYVVAQSGIVWDTRSV